MEEKKKPLLFRLGRGKRKGGWEEGEKGFLRLQTDCGFWELVLH